MAESKLKQNFGLKHFLSTSSLKVSVRKSAFQFLGVFILSLILSVSYSFLFDSPEEYLLKKENAAHEKNLKAIKSELDNLNEKLVEIQKKDDHLYRLLLGEKPLSEDIRTAGIGGSSNNSTYTGDNKDFNLSNYKSTLDQLEARLKVQDVSFEALTNIATENMDRIKHRPAIFPIAPDELIRVASGFGYRTHPLFQIKKFHDGVDLTALKGTLVYAPAKGKVISAADNQDGYGNKVIVDHGFGLKTVYAHLNKIQVKINQELDLGDVIGQVGNTGLSVAPHLHYEVRVNNEPINPMDFIFKDISAKEYQLITKR